VNTLDTLPFVSPKDLVRGRGLLRSGDMEVSVAAFEANLPRYENDRLWNFVCYFDSNSEHAAHEPITRSLVLELVGDTVTHKSVRVPQLFWRHYSSGRLEAVRV
jgi:hypothetical protein